MILKETLAILKDILEKTDVTNIEIRDAIDPVHVEYDEETLELKEDKDFPQEYDLVLNADLSHQEIQAIDEILTSYSNIEMRLREGNMEIFETWEEAH